jgi:hypothetical protein
MSDKAVLSPICLGSSVRSCGPRSNVFVLTCYRLHETVHGKVPEDLDDYIDVEEQRPEIYGPVDHNDFIAKLYVSVGPPHLPGWAGFVLDGFDSSSKHWGETPEGAFEQVQLP